MPCSFFFSSRRRHTRWTGDWSSDVCSSDLLTLGDRAWRDALKTAELDADAVDRVIVTGLHRSEERRVGKEGRSRWAPADEKEKIIREDEWADQWLTLRGRTGNDVVRSTASR